VNVDTSEFRALTDQVGALEATVAQLAKRVEQATTAEQIIRRASWPELPAARPAARPPRARHLRRVQ